ncbi:unnamed protein product [marine sediment metagenome]|uniref:Uncharacterized protein n=1 Tax=marine sediment metagenome TaxID=412755 RepID=X1EMG0_9ZZZZ
MKPWFKRTKKGTVASLLDKQQKENLKEFQKEQKRKNKLAKLQRQREERDARGKRKSVGGLGFPKKKRQGRTLSRKSRIGII